MPLRFVHVSDIHVGQGGEGDRAFDADVRRALELDCASMREKLGAADGVFVSGDVSYSASEEQFGEAALWLDRLSDACGCPRTSVWTVPGNHDVEWGEIDRTTELLHANLRKSDGKTAHRDLAALCTSKQAFADGALTKKLRRYAAFAEQYHSAPRSDAEPFWDTAYDLEPAGQLRIFGLTSALVSDKNDDKGKLCLGVHQCTALEAEADEFVLAILHHPLKYLRDEAEVTPYFSERTHVILTGHEHIREVRVTMDYYSGIQRLELSAGAVTPDEATGSIGYAYNWLCFSSVIDPPALAIEIWPRAHRPGAATFDVDYERTHGAESVQRCLSCPKIRLSAEAASPTEHAGPVGADHAEADDQAEGAAHVEKDDPRFEDLRLRFFRLSWQQRLRLLVELSLLPGGARLPTQALERRALEQLQRDNHRVDEFMKLLSAAEGETQVEGTDDE